MFSGRLTDSNIKAINIVFRGTIRNNDAGDVGQWFVLMMLEMLG